MQLRRAAAHAPSGARLRSRDTSTVQSKHHASISAVADTAGDTYDATSANCLLHVAVAASSPTAGTLRRFQPR